MSDVTDTPTQASRASAALELLALLTERYPEAFRHEGEPPRPLATGTGARLVAELALEPDVVNTAMRLYTRRRAYQQALAQPGAMRIDLTGQPTEPVAPRAPGRSAHPSPGCQGRPGNNYRVRRYHGPSCSSPSTNGKDYAPCLSPQP